MSTTENKVNRETITFSSPRGGNLNFPDGPGLISAGRNLNLPDGPGLISAGRNLNLPDGPGLISAGKNLNLSEDRPDDSRVKEFCRKLPNLIE